MKAGLRRIWRDARSNRIVGRLIGAVDRVWWVRMLHRSGLVDEEFYAAQRGWKKARPTRALLDYAWRGFSAGLSPNPLFDEVFAAAALPDTGRVPALYAYLVSDRSTVQVHPWWDFAAYCREQGITSGALEHAWRGRNQSRIPVVVASRSRSVPVSMWRQSVIAASRKTEIGQALPTRNRIVRSVHGSDATAAEKIASALSAVDGDTAAFLVCVDPTPTTWAMTAAAVEAWDDGAVAAIRVDAATTALQDVLRRALGSGVDGAMMMTDPRAELSSDQCRQLLHRGSDALTAPVVLDPDGTVASVGAEVVATAVGPRVARILREHPAEDLAGLGDRVIEVPLIAGSIFSAPAHLLRTFVEGARVEDFEAENLSVCARREGVGVNVDLSVVVGCFSPGGGWISRRRRLSAELQAAAAAGERSAAIYRDSGFAVETWSSASPTETRPQLRRLTRAQRWAIKTCAPAGPAGLVWGDTHFAQGLASALRRRGHEVVVDAFAAARRSTDYLDDVHVVIRGPFPIEPPAGGIRVEWIISHPDEITRAEVAGFDLVFAVSPGWAARTTRDWGVSIAPLLECTDADLFFPRGLARGDDIVFVGTARGIARPAVVAPLRAGVDVKVYGPDWRGFIPADAIAARSIPNRDLSERYETARVVLNDHWPAMRREGFMAMRPFDAVAAGGRVISESVPLLQEIFEGAVVEYESEGQLVELLTGDVDALFPSEERLREIAERVRMHHSFDARARVLDEAVGNLTKSAR